MATKTEKILVVDHHGMMNHNMMDQTMVMMRMMHRHMMNMTMAHLVDMMEDKDRIIDGMVHLINHRQDLILVVMVAEILMMIILVDGMEADMDGLIVDLAVIRMDRHHRRIIRKLRRNEQFILVNTILLSIHYVYYAN